MKYVELWCNNDSSDILVREPNLMRVRGAETSFQLTVALYRRYFINVGDNYFWPLYYLVLKRPN